jgi:hypothetical protein
MEETQTNALATTAQGGLNITESNTPMINFSDAVVRVTKTINIARPQAKHNRITMIVTPPEGGTIIDAAGGGLSVDASSPIDLTPYIHPDELNEVRNFVGTIRLHNDLNNLDAIYEKAYFFGLNLLFSSGATTFVRTNELALPNEAFFCWLTHSQDIITDDEMKLTQSQNVGIMLNQAKDERLIYAISRMTEFTDRVISTNQIVNDNFPAIVNRNQADALAGNNISFWLKTIQKSYPFALFLGGTQAYIKYWEAIIEFDVVEAIASFVSDGQTMGNLDLLGNTISVALGRFSNQLSDFTFAVPQLASMSEANKRAGIVDFVKIEFSVFGEIRIINIVI